MDTPSRPPHAPLAPGIEGQATTLVTDALTAPVVGSGSVGVYASPSMIALMEAAAVDCVERHLAPGQATLGVHLDVSHTAATPPGLSVTAKATLVAVDGRKLSFEIEARDPYEKIGTARHTRIIVDTKRFEAKVASKSL
ncbi:thioesterase family protein [Hyphomicrobium sp. LHD-15]|uniref:thioesterase family protein n=1 Tax=Hyphomicrobium sp. LHD-15 TaxID=3072142 RepID=UPI00280C8702|nr:thioesterase family protein [Hyphomicrobium sp. LHD-15]MDQ8700515.1 thioesterase family protein [Hyphomicrobium sp. LHD-15]